ncbi:hypothetical protein QBC39DRAFT_85195 [Podospora conica]|nr:hypothetical protein QBC39DRAFT_85195 [Schizothecium conicum]
MRMDKDGRHSAERKTATMTRDGLAVLVPTTDTPSVSRTRAAGCTWAVLTVGPRHSVLVMGWRIHAGLCHGVSLAVSWRNTPAATPQPPVCPDLKPGPPAPGHADRDLRDSLGVPVTCHCLDACHRHEAHGESDTKPPCPKPRVSGPPSHGLHGYRLPPTSREGGISESLHHIQMPWNGACPTKLCAHPRGSQPRRRRPLAPVSDSASSGYFDSALPIVGTLFYPRPGQRAWDVDTTSSPGQGIGGLLFLPLGPTDQVQVHQGCCQKKHGAGLLPRNPARNHARTTATTCCEHSGWMDDGVKISQADGGCQTQQPTRKKRPAQTHSGGSRSGVSLHRHTD